MHANSVPAKSVQALFKAALEHHQAGRLDQAEAGYRAVLEMQPDHVSSLGNLGAALLVRGRFSEVVTPLQRALALKSDYVEAHYNLGLTLYELGRLHDARRSHERCLAIKPDYADAHSNLLLSLCHLEGIQPADIFAEHHRFAERFEAPLISGWPTHANLRQPEKRLRVGFVSGDLRNHVVALFLEPVWQALSHQHLELLAYSNHAMEDAATARLKGLCDGWRKVVGWSDAALAQQIIEDGVDILVDLSGHTGCNRLPVFARKPAPVQVTWLGYPNTTGLQAMDYVLKDRFGAPHGAYEQYYVEKFARLPSSGTFLPDAGAPPVNELPALLTGSVTFGSFNRPSKLGDGVIALWSRVLRAVPGSRLLLCPVDEGSLCASLTERFAQCGVGAKRLIFYPHLAMNAYLALHHQVDFILDTFPYSGGTTTNHALWMGVPVLTLTGPSSVQCQSAGVLGRVGLLDWIVGNEEEFVQRAVDWAGRLKDLAELRAGMRERLLTSPLRQPETVASGLAAALRVMWRRWCAGLPAESFELTLEQLNLDAPSTQAAPIPIPEKSVQALFKAALEHHQAGRLAESAAGYRAVLAIQPDNAVANNNLGTALMSLGKIDEAIASYGRTLVIRPDYPSAHFNLGNILKAQKRLDEAIIAYREALRLKPDYPEAYNNLGNGLMELGRSDEAVAAYREALQLKPDYSEACNNLGIAFRELGRTEAAISSYREALRLKPDYSEAYNNLGNALQELGRSEEAISSYREALRLKPDFVVAHRNLGNALQAQQSPDEAISAYRDALRLKPDYPEALNNLGIVLHSRQRSEEALAAFREALRLKPDYGHAAAQAVHLMQHLCQWDELAPRTAELLQAITTASPLSEGIQPFGLLALDATPRQQQLCARQWVARSLPPPVNGPAFSHAIHRQPGQRLRIGYLSSDFREHATAYLMAGVFEAHDRHDFEIIAYAHGPSDDGEMRKRMERDFDRFEDVQTLSDRAAAEKIHADGIDILIDLNGYTQYCRPRILAYRPAPVVAQFLGYPGTMGTTMVDYLIADRFVVPEEQFPCYDEKIVYLPDSYQPNDPHRAIGPVPTRADAGLPESGFVYCSFNQTYKITPAIFDIWMNVLHATPDSVLWLLESNRWAPGNLRREAQARGVAPERIIFAPKLPQTEHLGRLQQADLVLDTLPYNAHTTASDALWVGVPVLTCPGATFASRVAGSLLQTMGLPELIADNLQQYQRLAAELAQQPESLAALKQKVRANRNSSALFDAGRFARHLESAYRAMWARYRRGEPPAHITVGTLNGTAHGQGSLDGARKLR